MTTKAPLLSGRPQHQLKSPVKGLTFVPFGFTVSVAGTITAADNANPPQLYATAGANNQEYNLQCPKGNPAKVWCFITCEDGITASVSDYSTIVNGTLVIDLDAAPVGNTLLKGVLVYGRNFAEGKGAVYAAPDHIAPLASTVHDECQSLLEGAVVMEVGWTVDGSNNVTETRGLPGVTVTGQGSGVYHIVQTHNTPPQYPANWAELFTASDGRLASFSHTVVGDKTTTIVTFENGVNMANGDRASVAIIGPDGGYDANYNGASGGVHSNLISRDIHTYTNYRAYSMSRSLSIIPFHATIPAGTGGPTEATSNLPPGFRIVRTGVGVYSVYIGTYPEASVVCLVNRSDGVATGVTAVDNDAGTLTITCASDPAGTVALNGLILVKTQSEV